MAAKFTDYLDAVTPHRIAYSAQESGSALREFLALVDETRSALATQGITVVQHSGDGEKLLTFGTPVGGNDLSRRWILGDENYMDRAAVFSCASRAPLQGDVVLGFVRFKAASNQWLLPGGQPFPFSGGRYQRSGVASALQHAMAHKLRLDTEALPGQV